MDPFRLGRLLAKVAGRLDQGRGGRFNHRRHRDGDGLDRGCLGFRHRRGSGSDWFQRRYWRCFCLDRDDGRGKSRLHGLLRLFHDIEDVERILAERIGGCRAGIDRRQLGLLRSRLGMGRYNAIALLAAATATTATAAPIVAIVDAGLRVLGNTLGVFLSRLGLAGFGDWPFGGCLLGDGPFGSFRLLQRRTCAILTANSTPATPASTAAMISLLAACVALRTGSFTALRRPPRRPRVCPLLPPLRPLRPQARRSASSV